MLVPQDTPCPQCGHPRRDHDLGTNVFGGESCAHCDCVIGIPYKKLDWDPDAEPRPLNWSEVPEWIALFVRSGWSFADIAQDARPRFALRSGEIEDLRAVENVMRELWLKYSPSSPTFAADHRNVAEENAAVDRYEAQKDDLYEILVNLLRTDDWRQKFEASDHQKIEAARTIIHRRGGNAGSL